MRLHLLLCAFLVAGSVFLAQCKDDTDSDNEVEIEVEDEDGAASKQTEDNDSEKGNDPNEVKEESKAQMNNTLIEPPPEIEYKVLKKVKKSKCRTRVTNDDTVGIHFVGKLASDGSVFYDSRENNEKDEWVAFPLGVGDSIKGLELGILGMCKGEIRRIVVEPELIKNGRYLFDPKEEKIPRDQKLIFEVEMMMMGPNYIKGLPNMFKVYDTNSDELLSQDEIAAYLIEGGQFGPAGPLIDKLAKEVIDRDDRNKDGKVQWKEFSGPKHDEL